MQFDLKQWQITNSETSLKPMVTVSHCHSNKTGSSPMNHSWHQKTRDTGLPDDEDRIPASRCSLVLTWHNASLWRTQPDGWTDGFAI